MGWSQGGGIGRRGVTEAGGHEMLVVNARRRRTSEFEESGCAGGIGVEGNPSGEAQKEGELK